MNKVSKMLVGAVAALAVFVGSALAPVETPVASSYPVKILTVDGQDYDAVRHTGTRVALYGKVVPVAPLMNWENKDIRERVPMQWCLQIPEEVKPEARNFLNELYGWYEGLSWYEGCNGARYWVTDKAQEDCGQQAMGCAAYLGDRSVRISYAGNLYRSGQARIGAVRVAIAHELGHTFNLAHVGCEIHSAMNPVYLPDGPSCGGVAGLLKEDYKLAEEYYGLQPEAPPPTVGKQIILRRWSEPSLNISGCQVVLVGYCIDDTKGPPPIGARQWYQVVIVLPNGELEVVNFDDNYTFYEVRP